MADLGAFISQWDGRRADYSGGDGGQCVDLVEFWITANGFPRAFGNAIDFAGQRWPGATWVPNTPSGVPSPGDVVVWGTGVGEFGHVDIFISGDANSFSGFDQNWPIGSLCHRVVHNYHGVLGWQALGVSGAAPAPPPYIPPPYVPPPPPPPVTPPVAAAPAGDGAVIVLLAAAGLLAGWTYWQHRRSGVPVTLASLRADVEAGLTSGAQIVTSGARDIERSGAGIVRSVWRA